MDDTGDFQDNCTVDSTMPSLDRLSGAQRGLACARPEGLIDRALLAFPDAFGAELAPVLLEARECVLRMGDAQSRAMLEWTAIDEEEHDQIKRLRRVLARRPSSAERRAPALLSFEDGLMIAMSHLVPQATRRLSLRIDGDSSGGPVSVGARRWVIPERILEQWSACGYGSTPCAVWRCDPPPWVCKARALVIEAAPNPCVFIEAMHIGINGAGRVLVATAADGVLLHETTSVGASVMASGWRYGGKTAHPTVRVPDDDLFALCASLTWTASLRDAIWLHERPDYRLLG